MFYMIETVICRMCANQILSRASSGQIQIALKAAGEGDEMAVRSFLDAGGDANAKGKTGSRCGNPSSVEHIVV